MRRRLTAAPRSTPARAVRRAGGPLRIRVRRATAGDTAAVLAFTRGTWGGRDYLPDVWRTWLGARDGVVLAAEALETDGAAWPGPIAVARLTMLAPGEAWMEGLRVDPAVQGRGVATAIQVAELAWAQAQGALIVRYATGEMNEASLRLGAHHGFVPSGRWRAVRPAALTGSPTGAGAKGRAPEPRERILSRLADAGAAVGPGGRLDDMWRRLGSDATFLRGGQLYEWRAWAWQSLTDARLAGHVARGELLEVGDRGPRSAAILAYERLPGETRVALLGGDVDAALRLVEAVATAAGRPPLVRLPDPSPLLEGIAPRLRQAGWAIGEHAIVLMSRPLVDETGRPLPLPEDGRDRIEFAEAPRPLGLVTAG